MEKMKDDTDSMLFLDGFTHDVTGRAVSNPLHFLLQLYLEYFDEYRSI